MQTVRPSAQLAAPSRESVPTAVYVRMSQDRAGAGLGVERQERECRELVDKLAGHTVTAVFSDNDVSASLDGEPSPGKWEREVLEHLLTGHAAMFPSRALVRTVMPQIACAAANRRCLGGQASCRCQGRAASSLALM